MTQATPDNNTATLPRLGHYQLQRCIGRGGMGLVYCARDTRLEREVAIKCLRTELFEAHYIERFKREALLLAKLNHPNIVQIYDFIEEPEQLALVMELVDGQNLHTYLREHIVPIAQRLQWLAQISEGLAVAHDAGIIHRDLKTENILINKRGQAKITDLGIAKSQDFKGTLTDHVAGSYCSMSPEQALGEAITFKSDLFSLGILAYQLLCGAHPFGDTSNKMQTMQRIISHPPTAPQQHNPDLPAEFIDLLGQLLSKDPDKRPDNTHWVAAQFEKLKDLGWREESLSDDTQALAIPLPANKPVRTQDHPTFETRFIAAAAIPKVSLWEKFKKYVSANKIVVSSATASLLIIAGIVVWQLQPKPPKYVAVIPPKLVAEGMQESQQELIKEAVYDAIQQSIMLKKNVYLIPREEITDINGSNEIIQKATSADELITTSIRCKLEACSITLTLLASDQKENTQGRLKVNGTKTIDALTDNYLSVAEIIQVNLSSLYPENAQNPFNKIKDTDYHLYLQANQELRNNGASTALLKKIESLQGNIKSSPALQILMREVSLDLYHETKDPVYLDNASKYIESYTTQKNSIPYFYNLYNLQVAQKDFQKVEATIAQLRKLNYSSSALNELHAHLMMAKGDYTAAINYFNKAIATKKTATILYNLANAYWYTGNTKEAQKTLNESLGLSPNYTKSHSLLGLISLLEGKLPQAITSFESAVIQNPKDVMNLSNLGLSYLLTRNYELAESNFRKASELAPDFNTLKLNIADAKNLSGRTEESHNIYKELLTSINHENISAENLRNLTQAYAHLGKATEALKYLKELEVKDPQNIETIFTSALVHTLTNNKTAATFNVESAIKNGMHPVWFTFSWFDSLCKESEFLNAMENYGAQERCAPIDTTKAP